MSLEEQRKNLTDRTLKHPYFDRYRNLDLLKTDENPRMGPEKT